MLKYFLLLLLAIPSLASEPKFHFGDCVRVEKGFYKDFSGQVARETNNKKLSVKFFAVVIIVVIIVVAFIFVFLKTWQ